MRRTEIPIIRNLHFQLDGIYENFREYADSNYELPRYSMECRKVESLVWIFLSALLFGFGNGLETISIFAWCHTFVLLIGFHKIVCCMNLTWACVITLLSQSLGVTIAFSSVFNVGSNIGASVGYCFGFGLLIWLIVIIVAILPHHIFISRYPSSPSLPFIYPITLTAVMYTIVGQYLSTFLALSTAVIDFGPLRQLASIFGAAGIHFVTVLAGAMAAFSVIRHKMSIFQPIVNISSALFVVLILIASYLIQADNIYQKNISTLIKPELNVSCIFAQSEPVKSNAWQSIWDNTRNRVNAKDNIILWAEGAVQVYNDLEESLLFSQAKSLLQTTNKSHLGVAYVRSHEDYDENIFLLLKPDGEVAWKYLKAHPVPVVEARVRAGPANLPIYDSPYGRLGGAICFDLDYPQFIRQASAAKVDILLQPSWTWGAIDNRHFEGNALRAIENGFTLFRCSSDGVSGVVSPRGVVWSRRYTGHDPTRVAVFTLPLWPRVETMYTYLGFVFEWMCLIATALIMAFAYIPRATLAKISTKINSLLGRTVSEQNDGFDYDPGNQNDTVLNPMPDDRL